MYRTFSLGGKEASDLQTPSKQESVLDYVIWDDVSFSEDVILGD